jgi:hypothetical protein
MAIIFAFLTIALLSCTQDIERAEVFGTYYPNYDTFVDSVTIRIDSTYCQYFRNENSKIDSNCGLWHFIPSDSSWDGPRIEFRDFLSTSFSDEIRRVYYYGTYITKTSSRERISDYAIRFIINTDLGQYFEMITPSEH